MAGMTTADGIDTTDYAILELLAEPLWKSQVHDTMLDVQDEQVMDGVPSLQTVGRHIDRLCDDGYLDSCVLAPDDVDRDLIIGFQRTAKGDDALAAKREELLQQVAHTVTNDACGPERTVTEEVLETLIADEFNLDAAVKTRIKEEFGEDELLSLLALHYAQENADTFATRDRSRTDNITSDENFQYLVR